MANAAPRSALFENINTSLVMSVITLISRPLLPSARPDMAHRQCYIYWRRAIGAAVVIYRPRDEIPHDIDQLLALINGK